MLRQFWQRVTASLRAQSQDAAPSRTAGVSPAPLTSPLNLNLPSRSAGLPRQQAGVSPTNLTLPLNLPLRADEESQASSESQNQSQPRRRDAGATNPAERELRAEIARLRAENRALLNSILGIAGIPPIVVSEAEAATEAAMLNIFPPATAPDPASSSTSFASSTSSISSSSPPRPDKPESPAPRRIRFKTDLRAPRPTGTAHNPAAPRRRSWQQINRMLELASARKPSQET